MHIYNVHESVTVICILVKQQKFSLSEMNTIVFHRQLIKFTNEIKSDLNCIQFETNH